MKWDIFGKQKIDRLGHKTDTIITTILELTEKIKLLTTEINIVISQTALLGKEIDKKFSKITEIPQVKSRIKGAEETWKKEQKEEQERESLNLHRI